jgi:hypothetical protein
MQDIRAGNPAFLNKSVKPEYTWPYSSWDARLCLSPGKPVSSYLTFSPLPVLRAVIFCSTCHILADIFPLGSMMPKRCPDFPPPVMDGKRWNGLLFFVKDTKKYAIRKTFFPASDWFVPHTPEP